MRVVEPRGDAGFAQESGAEVGVVGQGCGEELEGDVAVVLGVVGAVDLAHAAPSE